MVVQTRYHGSTDEGMAEIFVDILKKKENENLAAWMAKLTNENDEDIYEERNKKVDWTIAYLGNEGWQLVAVDTHQVKNIIKTRYYFKRPLDE